MSVSLDGSHPFRLIEGEKDVWREEGELVHLLGVHRRLTTNDRIREKTAV